MKKNQVTLNKWHENNQVSHDTAIGAFCENSSIISRSIIRKSPLKLKKSHSGSGGGGEKLTFYLPKLTCENMEYELSEKYHDIFKSKAIPTNRVLHIY